MLFLCCGRAFARMEGELGVVRRLGRTASLHAVGVHAGACFVAILGVVCWLGHTASWRVVSVHTDTRDRDWFPMPVRSSTCVPRDRSPCRCARVYSGRVCDTGFMSADLCDESFLLARPLVRDMEVECRRCLSIQDRHQSIRSPARLQDRHQRIRNHSASGAAACAQGLRSVCSGQA